MADPIFVVLTISGKVWRKPTETGYFGLLRDVYTEMQSAGGSWDAPWMLIMDRKVVIPEKLKDVAWEFCTEADKARWAAHARVEDKHRPEWFPKPEVK